MLQKRKSFPEPSHIPWVCVSNLCLPFWEFECFFQKSVFQEQLRCWIFICKHVVKSFVSLLLSILCIITTMSLHRYIHKLLQSLPSSWKV
jgi:hypothetical protein